MKIGLFFGTFNPVHLGHIEIVSRILDENIFDQLWIILSPRSPQKFFNLVKKENRLEMLNIAFQNYKNVLVSDIEFNLKEPNYTINTLTYIRFKFPKYHFSIIMGSDNFLKIKTWKQSKKIIENYSIYVYPRQGFNFQTQMSYKNIQYLNFPKIQISSTIIRDKIHHKERELEKYLPSGVRTYIRKHQLY
tara:strand:- start:453 stop:1022 length:570 start_codon:yes stop_codon:yes gene_type:complete